MKGIEMLSDLFLLFMLIIVVIMMTTLIWILTEFKVAASDVGAVNSKEVEIKVLFNPVKYDSALLTFLELNDPNSGIKMKRLLTAAAIQNTTNVWLPENKSFIDVSTASKTLLDEILPEDLYLLKTRNPEIVISQSGTATNWQKISTQLFLLNKKVVELELYVG